MELKLIHTVQWTVALDGQCGAPKATAPPVAILGADCCIVSDADARPPCIAYLHATFTDHQRPPAPYQGMHIYISRGVDAMQPYDTIL